MDNKKMISWLSDMMKYFDELAEDAYFDKNENDYSTFKGLADDLNPARAYLTSKCCEAAETLGGIWRAKDYFRFKHESAQHSQECFTRLSQIEAYLKGEMSL